MNRLIAVLAIVLAALVSSGSAVATEATKIARIGVLSPQDASKIAPWVQALRQGLRDLGWVEGRNIVLVYRHAEGRIERLSSLAAELVRLDPALIVALNGISARAVQRWSATIPIVMPYTADAVRQGVVTNLARPGGNITGLS